MDMDKQHTKQFMLYYIISYYVIIIRCCNVSQAQVFKKHYIPALNYFFSLTNTNTFKYIQSYMHDCKDHSTNMRPAVVKLKLFFFFFFTVYVDK